MNASKWLLPALKIPRVYLDRRLRDLTLQQAGEEDCISVSTVRVPSRRHGPKGQDFGRIMNRIPRQPPKNRRAAEMSLTDSSWQQRRTRVNRTSAISAKAS